MTYPSPGNPALEVRAGEARVLDFRLQLGVTRRGPIDRWLDRQKARVGSWRESANVGEVEILSDEESAGLLSGHPDRIVVASNQVFKDHGVGVVPKLRECAAANGRSS